MSDDKIAEIRARHEAGAPGEMPIVALAQCDSDREFLLAEIDRLRAVILTLEIVGKAADDERELLRGEVEKLTRERNEARAKASKLRAVLEMARDADNDCRVEGWATIPDAARRSIDDALEAKP